MQQGMGVVTAHTTVKVYVLLVKAKTIVKCVKFESFVEFPLCS